jgi:ribonuclease P protein component
MGCKLHTPHFILLRLENSGSCCRLGLTVSRKIGNAVQRNRVKRLLRDFFRNNQHLFDKSVDLSVVAKKGAADLSAKQIFSELERTLK